MANPIAHSQASLLGLPPELRLQIYDHVFALDLGHVILHGARTIHTNDEGWRTVVTTNSDEALRIPWLDLMLTCKSTATELNSLMQETSFLANKTNRTYVLDLEASRAGRSLGKTVWRHIPCRPNQAECLQANYNASRGLRAWGDGGPHAIVSNLYQTLNQLIHRGPRLFDSKVTLPQPMHLQELRIFVEPREGEEPTEENSTFESDEDPESVALSLGSIIGRVNNAGVLKGFVDSIRLQSSQNDLHWAVSEVERSESGLPALWSRYGFDWGV